MRTIWKFNLEVIGEQDVEMPQSAEILSAQDQFGDSQTIQLWAIVDDTKPTVRRRIEIVGTGHSAESVLGPKHLGTVQAFGGASIWHVFDKGEVSGTIEDTATGNGQ